MSDWFAQNAPANAAASSGGDWFAKNAPAAALPPDEELARRHGFDFAQIQRSPRYQEALRANGSGLSYLLGKDKAGFGYLGEMADSLVGDAYMGAVVDTRAGLQQGALWLGNKLGVISDEDKAYVDLAWRVVNDNYRQNVRGGKADAFIPKATRLVSNMAVPGPKVKSGKLGLVGNAAATGAVGASYQPRYEGNPNGETMERVKDVVLGSALGGTIGYTVGALGNRAAKGGGLRNPADADAVRFADESDIPVPLSVRTDSQMAQNLEKRAQHVFGSSGYARDMAENTRRALARKGAELAEEVSPGVPVTRERGGETVIEGFQGHIRTKHIGARQEYNKFHQWEEHPANLVDVQTGTRKVESSVLDPDGKPVTAEIPMTTKMPMPVDMREIKAALEPVAERYKYTLPQTDQRASKGLKAIQNILDGPDYKPASAAELDLGMLKEVARSEMPELRDISQGMAAHSLTQFERAIDEAVASAKAGGAEALTALRKGRKLTAEKWDAADLMDQFGKADKLEPVQVFQKLTWGRDSGVERLRKVQDVVGPVRMKEVGRAYVEGLLETATREGDFEKARTIFNQWHDLGPETKKALFGDPALIKNLDNFFHLAKRLAENPNPSGSGLMASMEAGGILIMTSPAVGAGYLIGNAALARALYNPRISQKLAAVLDGRAGAKAAAAAHDLLTFLRRDLGAVEQRAGRAVAGDR